MTTCHNDSDLAHILQLTRREIEVLPVWCAHRIKDVTFSDSDKPFQEYSITLSCREMEDLLDWFSHRTIEALNAANAVESETPEFTAAWRTYYLFSAMKEYVMKQRWDPDIIPGRYN